MKKYIKINNWVKIFLFAFVLFSFFSKTYADLRPTTIAIGNVDVSGTEISVGINAQWEDIEGEEAERIMWLLVQKYNTETKRVEGELKNIKIYASDFSNTGYLKFGNILVPNLTPEENYQIIFNLTEIPSGLFGSLKTLVLKTEPIYVKTSTIDQKNFSSVVKDGVVTFSPTTDKPGNEPGVYKLLAPIGGLTEAPENIGDYFNTIFLMAIGLCGVLAVIMIVIGGVQYMGDESIFGKTEAKSRITSAVLGLLIALGSYALLNTINPDLLGKGGISIKSVSAEIAGDTDAPIGGKESLPSGIVCSGGKTNLPNIVNSFANKMTYQMGAKGVAGPNNTIKLDCSGFVNYVLKCADIPFINGGTASIFTNAEKITTLNGASVNNKLLSMGDLVGWKAGENGEKYGHVMIYIGGGEVLVADSHGGTSVGKALGKFPISKYKDRIKYIKRAP